MGDRIQTIIYATRFLYKIEPKYPFKHLMVNLLLGIGCMFSAALGEVKLWWLFTLLFAVSSLFYVFRVLWFLRRRKLEVERGYGEATDMKGEVG